jgi:hypothetical protein
MGDDIVESRDKNACIKDFHSQNFSFCCKIQTMECKEDLPCSKDLEVVGLAIEV